MHMASMIHYLDSNLADHVMTLRIPIDDETGTLWHGDVLPAETMKYGAIIPARYDTHVGIDKVAMIIRSDAHRRTSCRLIAIGLLLMGQRGCVVV